MRPRILVNLGVFALIATVMCVWAAVTLLPIRFGGTVVRVEAEFASSPGLRAGLEVDYLGVPVGRIHEVRLRPGRVVVVLHLEDGADVPNSATAQVLRKSAVGEPYVELTSPPAAAATALKNGDVIPLSRTKSTVRYQELFQSAGRMLRAVDPADLKTVTSELGTGLNGQGQHLHDSLADLEHIATTVAGRSDVLDALAVQLTSLAGTLSDKRTQLASGVNDLAAFTATLGGTRKEIDSVLTRGPGFLDQVNGLLKDSRPAARCLLTALGTPATPVFTARNSRALGRALDQLHNQLPKVVDSVVERRPEGAYMRVQLVLTVAGPVPNAQEYARPAPDIAVPPLYYCRDAPVARAAGGAKATLPPAPRATDEAGRPQANRTTQLFETVTPSSAASAPAGERNGRGLSWLPLTLAALILLGTAANAVRRLRSPHPPRRRS